MDWTTINGTLSNLPISSDWIVIGGVALIAAFEVLRAGTGRVNALALALPASLLAFSALSRAAYLSGAIAGLSVPLHAAAIGVVFIAFYFLIRRMIESYGGGYGPLEAVIAGLSLAAIVVSVWIQVPELQAVWRFGPQVQAVFGEAYRFWWLAVAYAGLGYIGR